MAPMEGKLLRWSAQPGDLVEEDATIAVLEAMKMEIQVVAPVSGMLAEIKAQPGQAVDPDTVIAVIR